MSDIIRAMAPANLLAQINDILRNPSVQSSTRWFENNYFVSLPFLKTLSVFVTAFFIASTLFFMIRTGWLPTRIDRTEDIILKKNLPKKRTTSGWRKVQMNFFKGDHPNLKIAILDADKLLNDALKAAGFKGEDLGDRLKGVAREQLPNLDDVWEAHKLRNRIAHETDFRFNRDTAERALEAYEKAFKDLGIL